ncbi:MAG: hypothetical protein ACI4BC_03970 [Muribaculaceae bacterium]
MKLKPILLIAILACMFSLNAARQRGNVFVDKHGVMRDNTTHEESTFYGVNYTLPFAHAYRAVKSLGIEPKEAIDKDVYHIARMGLNAYRIHIWDVEITDAEGNLIENEHLDLLDYLIHRLEERGISVILTAQTNFGNGYPERNIPTGGYSYNYEKCRMHDTEECVLAQERYIKGLVRHKNRYNNKTYTTDDNIIALEINNEPCHSGTPEAATQYINRMAKAARNAGFEKPLLYNVSHNLTNHTKAFFKADIQGTTYQWYPTGLVSGHTRRGNYLPNIDEYDIPFSGVKGFDKMAKVVYEFDAGDIIDSYLYPVIARTFRTVGFQWITQFAYDPIDIADVNTEYQTHYLNLAYTPGKAIGMKIAAEVVKQVKRGEQFAKYPQDTIFGDFMVSYKQNLATLNDGKHYFHTNSTCLTPKDVVSIEQIAGVGSSPIVEYDGTGAYFIDKIGENLWRVEIMPDVFMIADPFGKPSPKRKVAITINKGHDMRVNLPLLEKNYHYRGVNEGNDDCGTASEGKFHAKPGVYIIGNNKEAVEQVNPGSKIGNIAVGEYVAPRESNVKSILLHTPALTTTKGTIRVKAQVVGSIEPDSVVVYPRHISFWSDHNTLYRMNRTSAYDYEVEIPSADAEYNIVVYNEGKATTYPQGVEGTPLDWDFTDYRYYSTKVMEKDTPMVLVRANASLSDIEMATIPNYSRIGCRYSGEEPTGVDYMEFTMTASTDSTSLYLRKWVGDIVNGTSKQRINVSIGTIEGVQEIDIAVITKMGITYRKRLKVYNNGILKMDLSEMSQDYTALIPAPYPDFLNRKFYTPESIPLKTEEIEQIEISTPAVEKGSTVRLQLRSVWLE